MKLTRPTFQMILVLFGVFAGPLSAETKNQLTLPSLKKLRVMNGIDPGPYDQFWNRWNLVTTRYRQDNGEQRFVYANKTAYYAMKRGLLKFPDGSAFGKLAFKTKADAQFPNSFEPTNFTRMQLMVKNQDKFRKMDGWSYYIYVDGKSHSPKHDQSKNMACHACHTLVKKRDFVFSAPTFLNFKGELYSQIGDTFRSKFQQVPVAKLPSFEASLLSLLSSRPEKIMIRRMRLFSGSLSESIGPLASYAQDGMIYAIVDPVKNSYLIAEKQPATFGKCPTSGTIIHMSSVNKGKHTTKKGLVCEGKNQWLSTLLTPVNIKNTF